MVVNLVVVLSLMKRELSKSYLSLVPPTPFCVRPSPVGLMGPDPDLHAPQLSDLLIWAGGLVYLFTVVTDWLRLVSGQWTYTRWYLLLKY